MKLPFLAARRRPRPIPDGYVLDPARLTRLARANARAYQTAKPFPHIALDDVLPSAAVDAVLAEFPGEDSPYWAFKRSRTSVKQDSRRADKELFLPPFIRRLIWELNSAVFLLFLSELTGIEGLTPDPYLEGGGVHQIPRGGFLKIHADFNRHPVTDLHRRLNVLIYLNKDWRPEYGGDLELWPEDMSRCARRIAPLAGRMAVFSTSDTSYHGHPDPLACPPGSTRKSLALYYYTAERPADEGAARHSTLYQTRPVDA